MNREVFKLWNLRVYRNLQTTIHNSQGFEEIPQAVIYECEFMNALSHSSAEPKLYEITSALGSLLPQAATSERQKCLSHIPAFRNPVLAADRASTDWNLAEQGNISELSRHKCIKKKKKDHTRCRDLSTEQNLAAQL